jgi:malate synthase
MTINTITKPRVHIDAVKQFPEILTDKALVFLQALHQKFEPARQLLLQNRECQQAQFDAGRFPDFPSETENLREGDWTVGPIPADLQDRRVEITGPTDRKMVINALNSGAKTFMADLEDSTAPSWNNVVEGQINLRDAVNGSIEFTHPEKNKTYQLNESPAVLLVRPRGLHLDERHCLVEEVNISGSLFDFGLYFFYNVQALLEKGTAPYFYLPKLEHYNEARWWNEVFIFAQELLNIPIGTIKATVLVETITASFQLDEIIYELRDHIVGLNCGRWDYIFSYIKKLRYHKQFTMPDRSQVTMGAPLMAAYSKYVIQRCHKRGILAIGGMAAQIPIKGDDRRNERALRKVAKDKITEVKNGHDGTWVAHPGLVPLAMEIFDRHIPAPNQLDKTLDDLVVTQKDLLAQPQGTITEKGVRLNINVGIRYLEAWLQGFGAVALNNLMEDAATAEISRAQLWQWVKHEAIMEDGRKMDLLLYKDLLDEEIEILETQRNCAENDCSYLQAAIELFDDLVTREDFVEFLTIPAYQQI